jgi:peptidoglycan/xylan/chitin deacetylase (PgdA/CDA1 family)
MSKFNRVLLIGTVSLLVACSSSRQLPDQNGLPLIILKLDDLWYEDGLVHPGWLQLVDYLNDQEVTGTIGLVCESLEDADGAYYEWIADRIAEGYEIWHHGYCHCKPERNGVPVREFRGTDYEYQASHIVEAHQLAKDKLGITMHTFGAPYNSTDSLTAIALEQVPDIKVWMYKETPWPTNKYVLPRIKEVNIEYPVHVPDFEQFKAGYEQYRSEEILVIQGHPRSWAEDPERFEAFKDIISFLKSQGVNFTTPYAYYQQKKSK